MNEELKKALEELSALKAKLDAGVVGKEYFETEQGKLKAEIESIQARLKEFSEMLTKRQTAMEGDKSLENFSRGRALCGILLNKWYNPELGTFADKGKSFEYAKLQEYAEAIGKANEITSTGGAGGYAIPPQAIQNWIERLYANTVVKQAGATLLTGLTGSPVTIPRHSSSLTAYWIGEGDEITGSGIGDQQLSLTPKELAALYVIQNKTLILAASNPSLENLLLGDMDMQIQLGVDLGALRGTGASNQPTGVANTSSINTLALGTNGDYFDFDDVIDMETELMIDNALRGNLAFVTHPYIKQRLRKTKIAQYSGDTAGEYIVKSLSDENLKAELGYPMYTTTQLPTNLEKGSSGTVCSEVYFANWSDLIIAQWGGIDIARSDSAGSAFEKNQTKVRMIQMVDIAARHPESFCLCNDAKTE